MAASQKRTSPKARDEGSHGGTRPGRVTESGRLSLPAEVRREVGLEKGGAVRIDVVDGVIRIHTMKDVMKRIRELARKTGLTEKASVAGFLAWRDEERAKESASSRGKKA